MKHPTQVPRALQGEASKRIKFYFQTLLVGLKNSHANNEHGSHKNHTLEAKVKHHHHKMLTLTCRQRRCDESTHLSHIKHGHNNIERNEHCGGTTCNVAFHNAHK